MIQWTVINETEPSGGEPRTITDRMEVSGGYIVRTRVHGVGPHRMEPPSVAMVFVPGTAASIYDEAPGGDAVQHLSS